MDKNRKREMKWDQVYSYLGLRDEDDWYKCFYCGLPASSVDHQPPLSVISSMVTAGEPFEAVRIPACLECNSLLSNYKTFTVAERFDLAKNKLRKKYRKELKIAGTWAEEDLAEFGRALRSMIKASMILGNEAQGRILYPGHALEPMLSYWQDFTLCRECGEYFEGRECPRCGGSL